MKLKLKHLQDIVKDALNEEKSFNALKTETKRVLGPVMNTNLTQIELAESINDRLDTLELTGRKHDRFNTTVIKQFAKHKNSELRSLAARLLPETMLNSMVSDKSSKVRIAVAKRADLKSVKEMIRKFPTDEEIRLIYAQRQDSLNEASDPIEDFDLYGDKAMGDASRTYDTDLSDAWYSNKAKELHADYSHHGEIDINWIRAVNGFCDNLRVSSGVEIDKKKLHDALNDYLTEKEDELLGLNESVDQFAFGVLKEHRNMNVFPVFEENVIDPVKDVVSEKSGDRIEKIKKLFQITETSVPNGLKRYLINESYQTNKVPVTGLLPHRNEIRHIDEKALDIFVESWNSKQKQKSEPFNLTWSQDPNESNKIEFRVTVR